MGFGNHFQNHSTRNNPSRMAARRPLRRIGTRFSQASNKTLSKMRIASIVPARRRRRYNAILSVADRKTRNGKSGTGSAEPLAYSAANFIHDNAMLRSAS